MQRKEVTIHFDKLLETGLIGVRRAAAFLSMGQRAWSDDEIKSVALEAPISIKLLPDPLPKELADDIRANFRLWVTGNVLSELVQGLSHFADEFFHIATLIEFHEKALTRAAIDRIDKFIKDTSMASKMKAISEERGIDRGLTKYVEGWVRGRNAVAHNRGIINERTVDDQQVLKISWQEFEFSIDGEKIENIIGHHVESGGILGFRMVDGGKTFKLGSLIDLSEQEIMNMCFTSWVHVHNMVDALQKRLTPPENAQQPPAPTAPPLGANS